MALYIIKEIGENENGMEFLSNLYLLEHDRNMSLENFHELERKYRYSDYPKKKQSAYETALDLETHEGFRLLPSITCYL